MSQWTIIFMTLGCRGEPGGIIISLALKRTALQGGEYSQSVKIKRYLRVWITHGEFFYSYVML